MLVVELKNCSINDNKYNNICAYVHQQQCNYYGEDLGLCIMLPESRV